MTDRQVRRGTVWTREYGPGLGRKPVLVVSNNGRNRSSYPDVHVVRVTSRPRPPLATIVELRPDDPVEGRVICDELEPLDREDLLEEPWGGWHLTDETMERIDHALRIVLDL